MKSIIQKILSEFMLIPSPSANEDHMRKKIISYIESYVDNISTDALGNLCLLNSGYGNNRKSLMIVAHMDEIGIIITHVDDNGFIRFDNIGGVDSNILIGREVQIITNNGIITGVIGAISPNIKKDIAKKVEVSDLWIDMGYRDKNEALTYVEIGNTGVIKSDFTELHNDRIAMRSADNKVGLTILVSLLSKLNDNRLVNLDTIIVASTQEEIGLRGAAALCEKYHPDYTIVLDVTHATDSPGINKYIYGDIKLGNGPVIPTSADSSKEFQILIKSIAQKNNIPYQIQAFARATGTDLNAIQLKQSLTQTGLLCVPCRYMHTPYEVVSIRDIENTIQILLHLIKELDRGVRPNTI